MKKLLLSGAALVAMAAAPAQAEGLSLDVAGHFKGYAAYNDQDTPDGTSLREFDFRKETEVHFTGETTLDNGLTVGAHVELDVDGSDDDATVDESYVYMSGGWGRVNFGEEDGAAYLLQVAAPSADANVDGLRQYINTFDLSQLVGANAGLTTDVLDYDHAPAEDANKFTYMTPVFNGFQAGVSYIPSITDTPDSTGAMGTEDGTGEFDDGYELAARYEGAFEGLGIALGAGIGNYAREETAAGQDDQQVWNAGVDFDWNMLGFGVAYLQDDNGVEDDGDTTTWVAGVDYQMGAYKLGLSYLMREDEAGSPVNPGTTELETNRWTGGVTYSYGPGMSFRGALSYVDAETGTAGDDERDGYQVTVGTQINF